jgi:hypothetical protein
VNEAVDGLYALPPSEFTAARDAAVKELRAAGKREEADELKRLKRPSPAAHAVNLLARERPDELAELFGAQERLRQAQSGALGGGGSRQLRDATAEERQIVAALAKAAEALARASAGKLPAGVGEKVSATLHAAATDEDLRAAIEAGRLDREREAVGFGDPAAAFAAPKESGRAGKRPAKDEKRPAAARRALEKAERAARTAAKDVDAAGKVADRARRRHAAAERRFDTAREELEQSQAALREAEEERDAAEARARDASGALERARAEAE